MEERFNHSDVFRTAFENRCFQLFVSSYNSIKSDNIQVSNWLENDITSTLNHYIFQNANRIKWKIVSCREEYLYDENTVKVKGFADKEYRIDMKMTTINSLKEYVFYFEAKNLKESDSKLKQRYISTGIDSFVSGKYRNGAMIGFLMSGNLINTISGMNGINHLLLKDNRATEILKKCEFKFHDSYYESAHISIGILKHLIFDLTSNETNL